MAAGTYPEHPSSSSLAHTLPCENLHVSPNLHVPFGRRGRVRLVHVPVWDGVLLVDWKIRAAQGIV